MIGTLQALLVAVIAVLPGALYTIARENHGASWAWRRTDGATLIFRFLAFSAVFHALFAWLSYLAYQQLVVTDDLYNGQAISWWWYLALLAYTAIPYLWGVLVEKERQGRLIQGVPRWKSVQKVLRWRLASKVLRWGEPGRLISWWRSDSPPELRAWDFLFSKRQVGVVRLRLTNDEWKAGLWADSFASSYGEEGDLYLAHQYLVDEDGVLLQDAYGAYLPGGAGLLIRWSEVRYLEFSKWAEPRKPPEASAGPRKGPEEWSPDG
jgi:hypothetical protein